MKKRVWMGGVALVAMASAGFAQDSVWMQQKSVAIGAASFQQCVTTAVAGVPGVLVNRAVASSADKVALDVRLAKPIPLLDAEVQHRNGSSAVIVFSGSGASEPDADRASITPVLQSIADAIGRTCGAGNKGK